MACNALATRARALSVALGSALLSAGTASAQGAAVRGTVFDSLVTRAPLAGAEVVIVGVGRSAFTDQRGHFRIDSLPPGRHAISFFHTILDSLSVGAGLFAVVIPDTGTASIALATPSPRTLYSRLCPSRRPEATGLVFGRVRDVDTESPLPGATIGASWTQWTIGKRGIERNEQHARATTDSSGAYALCGVPTDVPIVIRAQADAFQSGPAVVQYDAKSVIALRDFAISRLDSAAHVRSQATPLDLGAPGDSAVPRRGGARISGVVRTLDGRPISGAQAAVLGLPISTTTDSAGAFYIAGLPGGTQTIEVRAIGFAPVRRSATLKSGTNGRLDVVLDKNITVLPEVSVLGSGDRLDRVGFELRRRQGLGYFVTREDIARRRVFDVAQLFYMAPRVRVQWDGRTNVVKIARGAMGDGTLGTCDPDILVDGIPAVSMDDVRPADVRGVELYTNPAEVPAQYRRGYSTCGAILIWTSPTLRRR